MHQSSSISPCFNPSFGSPINEMQFKSDTGGGYRYGFNNQEKDNELGDYYAFEYRIQDARLGRLLSVDFLFREYPNLSNYSFVGNSPIVNIEVDGLYYQTYKYGYYSLRITNGDWIENMDKATAIPVFGVVAEVSLWLARAADPSFKANTGDYLGIILQIAGAGSLKLINKLAKIDGLGKILLTTNREFVNSALALMTNPNTAEVGVDMLAAKSLSDEGIGDFFIDNTGKEITHNFQFKISYTKSLEEEIKKDKELTSKKDFDLRAEVEKRLQKVMDDKKKEIVKVLKSNEEKG